MTRVAWRSVTAIKASIIVKIEDSKHHENRSFLQVTAKLRLEMIIDYPWRLLERITVTMPSESSTCNFLQYKETNGEDKIHLLICINASLTPTTNTPVGEKKTHGLGEIHYCVFN